jgi:hypothetical protein
MMPNRYSIRTGAVALVANATKSVILIPSSATHRFLITQLSFGIDGAAAAAGVAVELYAVTTIGTPAGTNFTPVPVTRGEPATAQVGTCLVNLTTEPTAVEVMEDWDVNPYGGQLVLPFPLGREPWSTVGTTNRLGLRYVNPSGGSTANYRAYIEIEE